MTSPTAPHASLDPPAPAALAARKRGQAEDRRRRVIETRLYVAAGAMAATVTLWTSFVVRRSFDPSPPVQLSPAVDRSAAGGAQLGPTLRVRLAIPEGFELGLVDRAAVGGREPSPGSERAGWAGTPTVVGPAGVSPLAPATPLSPSVAQPTAAPAWASPSPPTSRDAPAHPFSWSVPGALPTCSPCTFRSSGVDPIGASAHAPRGREEVG
ncbi:MAG: hypothetical protein FJ029_12070 [Actinobacteria bacterium]|nr:hypothetical protein [Actinomycetota bacterium]